MSVNASKQNRKVFLEISKDSTPLGRIIIELRDDVVPITSKNFYDLCCVTEKGKGYIGSKIHRVINQFMMQGGDYTKGNGTGGRPYSGGEKFKDENFNLKHTEPGILSMANCGPDTNGSQFFITFVECPWLDDRHVVFGKVIEGMDVVKKVEQYGTPNGKPKVELIISNCGAVKD